MVQGNTVELSYFAVRTAASNLGRAASGRIDMIDPVRVDAEIKALRKALRELEVVNRTFRAERRLQRQQEMLDRKAEEARLAAWLESHPEEMERAIQLKLVAPPKVEKEETVETVEPVAEMTETVDAVPSFRQLVSNPAAALLKDFIGIELPRKQAQA